MLSIYSNFTKGSTALLRSVYEGNLHLFSCNSSSAFLRDFIETKLRTTFPEEHPKRAQFVLSDKEYFSRISSLRIHLAQSKELRELVQTFLLQFGFDASLTYFDVVRLRAITSDGHKNPKAAPVYFAHRDIWYANHLSQVNWWIPIYSTVAEQAFAFYPAYWNRPVLNSSNEFDYTLFAKQGGWQSYDGVKQAMQHHPTVTEMLDTSSALRIACQQGETLVFSGAHLHSTLPNETGETRFSIEIRTVFLPDVLSETGASKNILKGVPSFDNESRGSTLRDFLCLKDFSSFPVKYL